MEHQDKLKLKDLITVTVTEVSYLPLYLLNGRYNSKWTSNNGVPKKVHQCQSSQCNR